MGIEIIDCDTIFGPWPMVRADMSVDRLVKALKSHDVSSALTISTVGILHNWGDGNSETLRSCQGRELLLPVATIDPRGYFGPKGSVAKLFEQGFRMLRFYPEVQDWCFNHSVFGDILDELDGVNVPLMVEASGSGFTSFLSDAVRGRDMTILLDGISFETLAEAVSVMRKNKNFVLITRDLRVPGALRFVVDQIGVERVVFGSGCLRNSLAAAIGCIVDSELSDDQKTMIMSGNIKRLLGG